MPENMPVTRADLCIGKRCGGIQGSLYCVNETKIRFCKACYEQLKAELKDLPSIYNSLVYVIHAPPQAPFQRVNGVRGASGMRIDDDVCSARSEILGFVRSWSALVADECSVRKPARHDCGSLASFLLRHLEWLLAHPAAGDFEEETYALTVHVRQVSDSASKQIDIGPCVRPGCDALLFAVQSAINGRHEVHCGAGHVWQASQWLQLYRQLQALR